MSELSTQESSDDLDPISESPSKTFDGDRSAESSSENDETLEDDENLEQNNDNFIQEQQKTLDTTNANLDFRTMTADVENNIPVSFWHFWNLNCVPN